MSPPAPVQAWAPPIGAERAQQLCADAAAMDGADETEVALVSRRGEHTRFAGSRIHQAQDLSEWSVSVRCRVGEADGRSSTSDLDDVEGAVRRAQASARAATAPRSRPAVGVAGPLPAAVPGLASGPGGSDRVGSGPGASEHAASGRGPWDPAVGGLDAGVRAHMAHTAIAAAEAAGAVAAGVYWRAATEMAVATSLGLARYCAGTEVGASFTVRRHDGSSHWVDLDRRSEGVEPAPALEQAIAAAASTQGRRPLPAGTYDVVLGPAAVGGLLESFGAFGFTGPSAASGVGAVAQRQGEAVASPLVTLSDDATGSSGLPWPFDIEGTDRRGVTLLDRGRVGAAVTDRASAARLGLPSTGHAHIAREEAPRPVCTNLVLAAGDSSIDELVAGVERGVYIERFWYLRVVDPGRTSLTGVSRDAAWMIEDGRRTTAVAGARWTNAVFDLLARVDGVSRQSCAQPLSNIWNGCVRAPALRIRGFSFGPPAPQGATP